ncbi:hypothetical protein [Paramagnetospirillum caucaseum]|nr:hypothetical protein [Paramagnetospirillum caucaseum]
MAFEIVRTTFWVDAWVTVVEVATAVGRVLLLLPEAWTTPVEQANEKTPIASIRVRRIILLQKCVLTGWPGIFLEF